VITSLPTVPAIPSMDREPLIMLAMFDPSNQPSLPETLAMTAESSQLSATGPVRWRGRVRRNRLPRVAGVRRASRDRRQQQWGADEKVRELARVMALVLLDVVQQLETVVPPASLGPARLHDDSRIAACHIDQDVEHLL